MDLTGARDRSLTADTERDTNSLANFPQWEKLRNGLQENYKDIVLWDELVALIEDLVSKHLKVIKNNNDLKKVIRDDFELLLSKFPFLTDYWKRFVTIQYTLEGLQSSVEVLEKAVTVYPNSVDLWLDYLNITITNNSLDEAGVRKLFADALTNVGRQFLSHPVWDLYLDWESQHSGKNSNEYLNILLKVIRLPLHQYARYFESLYEITPNFTIEDLVPSETLTGMINERFPGSELQDLEADQIKEINDAYFNDIFNKSYAGTNERWEYESQLTKQTFDLLPVTEEEMSKWLDYLEYEEKQGDFEQIKSLYERALIPTCSYETIWLRYVRFLIKNSDIEANKTYIVSLFNKACDVFVSIDQPRIRYTFAKFYEVKLNDTEEAMQIYTALISQLPTEIDPVIKCFAFLCRLKGEKETIDGSLTLVRSYINENRPDSSSQEPARKKKKPAKSLPLVSSLAPEFQELYRCLSIWNVSQLIVEVAKLYWLKDHNIKATRDLLISFFKEEIVKCSVSYWSFFFKFELVQQNKKNLTNIIQYVKYYGKIPTTTINNLIQLYVTFLFQNSTLEELNGLSREIIRYYLEIDPESSTHMKHFLKSRLDPGHDEEVVNKRLIMENGHPGMISEHRPRLLDPISCDGSLSEQKEASRMPRFTNVERASAPVKYIQE